MFEQILMDRFEKREEISEKVCYSKDYSKNNKHVVWQVFDAGVGYIILKDDDYESNESKGEFVKWFRSREDAIEFCYEEVKKDQLA